MFVMTSLGWSVPGPWVVAGGASLPGLPPPLPSTHTRAKLVGEEKKIKFLFCNPIFYLSNTHQPSIKPTKELREFLYSVLLITSIRLFMFLKTYSSII